MASVAWFWICGRLLESQLQMLVWIGTANAGPDPGLAKDCFRVTAIAIVALVAEGYFVSFAEAATSARRAKRAYRALYTNDERSDLANAIQAARRPTPEPQPDFTRAGRLTAAAHSCVATASVLRTPLR
ncbi:hypothetical protein [Streptomyces sp. NPDC057287]|uniref:hypothetical protein n=1 Tax=Streptomyces sp. NPDC057287 TaxID=3346086 RepID=UPI00364117E6